MGVIGLSFILLAFLIFFYFASFFALKSKVRWPALTSAGTSLLIFSLTSLIFVEIYLRIFLRGLH